jgi:hypothetical protein
MIPLGSLTVAASAQRPVVFITGAAREQPKSPRTPVLVFSCFEVAASEQ